MITYLSAGNGHRSAARAIETALKARYPGIQVATPLDLASVSWVGKLAAKTFYPLLKTGLYPRFFRMTDRSAVHHGLFDRFRRWVEMRTSKAYLSTVRKFKPDVVISTHLLGADLLANAMDRGKLPGKIKNFDVVTDEYGHGAYVMDHLDGTFVPSREVAYQLASKGLPAARLYQSGIPIDPVFSTRPARAEARKSLGFDPNGRVLLVQGNLLDGLAPYQQLMRQLSAAYPAGIQGKPVEVAVAAGKNAELYGQLKDLASQYGGPVRLRPFEQLAPEQMRDLMAASDLSLTKPGGLTTAESVAMQLPMVMLDVMGGGQETYNADHFRRMGAGVVSNGVDEATRQVVTLLGQDGRLAGMREAAGRIAHPRAAETIADAAIRSIAPPSAQA